MFTLRKIFVSFAKNSVNRRPFLVRTMFFHLPKLLSCHQTSKVPSRIFGGLQSFVRRQNPLFLASYPSSRHLISRTWLWKVPSGYTKKFTCLRCDQGCKNEKTLVFVVVRTGLSVRRIQPLLSWTPWFKYGFFGGIQNTYFTNVSAHIQYKCCGEIAL